MNLVIFHCTKRIYTKRNHFGPDPRYAVNAGPRYNLPYQLTIGRPVRLSGLWTNHAYTALQSSNQAASNHFPCCAFLPQ